AGEQTAERVLLQTVEHRGGDRVARTALRGDLRHVVLPREVALRGQRDVPALRGDPSEVDLEHLADVHSSRDTHGVEDDVDGRAVLEERHVLDREDRRDDALVPVTAGELVTRGDLAS